MPLNARTSAPTSPGPETSTRAVWSPAATRFAASAVASSGRTTPRASQDARTSAATSKKASISRKGTR